MNRSLPIFVLSLILLQALLLPITVQANGDAQLPCPATYTVTFKTLPATDITFHTAVFNGEIIETMTIIKGLLLKQKEPEYPWVFEYGTAPGVYTHRVNAEIDMSSLSYNSVDNEEYHIETVSMNFNASVRDLSPCTTYYVRFRFLDTIPLDENCLTVKLADEVKFTTTGCELLEDETHQSGGMSAVTPTLRPFIMSNIVVQSASMAATKAAPGENVDVAATITNRGGSNGTSKVTLFVNGQEAESKGITLTSGESTQVHFSISRNDPGTYSVYVNGVPAGNLTVDLFTSNDILIYSVIALFTIGIIGVLYLVFKRRAA